MKRVHAWIFRTLCCLSLMSPALVLSQAPGEDPIQLSSPVSYQGFPLGGEAPSSAIVHESGLPGWLQAKVSRYEAQSYADVTDKYVSTDADVVTTVRGAGQNKTCVQEVGSNTSMARAGGTSQVRSGANNTQIVVLRGDMVNVCR